MSEIITESFPIAKAAQLSGLNKATDALISMARIAKSSEKQEKDLADQLATVKQQLGVLQSTANSERDAAIAAARAANIQADSNKSLRVTAGAERDAAIASASAAQIQAEGLKLQNRQLLLTFRPQLEVDMVSVDKSQTGDPEKDQFYYFKKNMINTKLTISNKGSIAAVDYEVDWSPYTRATDRLGEDWKKHRDALEAAQAMNCKNAESAPSTYHHEIISGGNVALELQFTPLARFFYQRNGYKSAEIIGCVAYKGLDERIYHHVRFAYEIAIAGDPRTSKFASAIAQDSWGNFSD